jgi:hypothetical protein
VRETTIFCSSQIRKLWPLPLASQWARLYPQLFDGDDVRITRQQPRNHFAEWFAAIHLFHRDGMLALVEKYVFGTHPRKQDVLKRLMTPCQQATLDEIRRTFRVQPPDLLVYAPDHSAFCFAEVKGPGDQLRDAQRQSHQAIEQRLGVAVELITVRLL